MLFRSNTQLRLQMGENGYKRVKAGYQFRYMQDEYKKIYQDFAESMELKWEEESTAAGSREG